MSTEADYTDAEWRLLTDLPRLAALGAMAAEEGGPITSTRELWAGMMELARAARASYPTTTLIREITQAITQDDDGADMRMAGWNPGSGDELGTAMIEQTLETAARVPEVLADHATAEESAAYTAWVLGIARAGCEAARSGLFGLSGEQVTEREARFIQDLSTALGAS